MATKRAKESKKSPLIIIASNRGPFSFTAKEDGEFDYKRGAGGLVTALASVAQDHDVLWVANALSDDDRQWAEKNKKATLVDDTLLKLIVPDLDSYNQFYNVIANPLLWFIQHQMWDSTHNPSITQETWDAWENGYVALNQLFADAIIESIDDPKRPVIILPQDYHLYLVPKMLRDALGDQVQIQPFIHIPWPGPDGWIILPNRIRTEMLEGLLASDRVGFQTKKDAFNFVQTARFYLEEKAKSRGSRNSLDYDGRKVGANTYPISVDVEKLNTLTETTEISLFKNQILALIGDRKMILRADRIEPSKNILRGLEAYKTMLQNHPEHHGRVQFLMLLVPSRLDVDEYHSYLQEIMAASGLINAEFSDGFWEPVRTIVGGNYNRAIAAMQLYDVLLINPIADGMNLVAKEGVLVNQRDGQLVLSENAGAVFELGEAALTVSPYDVHGTAQALHDALTLPPEERATRAQRLKEIVENADITKWFQDQIQDALREMNVEIASKKASTSETSKAKKSADS